jgi:hypothetical protein
MRIAAHLGVKDELELIEGTIAHLRMIGVDHIIVCDACSTDGTAEILERYRSPEFQVLQLPNDTPSLLWNSSNLELIRRADADWMLFLDADERWTPASGDLRRHAAGLVDADVVLVDRFNVPLGPSGPWCPEEPVAGRLDELMLFANPGPEARGIKMRARLADDPSLAWIRGVPAPKVMVRPERIAEVPDGTHHIVGTEGPPLRHAKAADLLIAHLALTTWERFARKVANIAQLFSEHPEYRDQISAWHWSRWLTLSENGGLEAEFQRSILPRQELVELHRQGIVQSAAEVFRSRSTAT